MSDDGFLSRWSRRKREAAAAPASPPDVPVPVEARVVDPGAATAMPPAPATTPADAAPPAPTLDDVAALAPGDEVSRFVVRGVDEQVKRAAVKRLFSDPHFNVMDGLDTYIDDYGRPDPLPAAMLRQLRQARHLGLFDDSAEAADVGAAPAPPADPIPSPAQDADATASAAAAVPHADDEDPDLQLQSDDAAGRPGAAARAGTAGR